MAQFLHVHPVRGPGGVRSCCPAHVLFLEPEPTAQPSFMASLSQTEVSEAQGPRTGSLSWLKGPENWLCLGLCDFPLGLFSPLTPNPTAQGQVAGHGWLPHCWGEGEPEQEGHAHRSTASTSTS